MYTPKGEINDELMKLAENPEYLKAMENCKSPEEAYEVTKKELPNMTMEELDRSMGIMHSYLKEQEEGLLNEEDLDAVAGGKSTAEKVTGAMGAVGGVAGAAGALVSSLAGASTAAA